MSLINDALKRANEEKSKPPTAAEISANLQPVITPDADNKQFWQVFCVVGLVGIAIWLGWAWIGGNSRDSQNHDRAASENAAIEVAARVLSPTPAIPGASTPASTSAGSFADHTPTQAPSNGLEPSSPLAPITTSQPTLSEAPTPSQTAKPQTEIAQPEAPSPSPSPSANTEASRTVSIESPSFPQNSAPHSVTTTSSQAGSNKKPNPRKSTGTAAVAAPIPNPGSASQPQSQPDAAEAVQTTFPKLVLQGIYYRPSRPAAVINAKTVYVGDKVSQAKILAIDRQEVTLQWNGEIRVLALE